MQYRDVRSLVQVHSEPSRPRQLSASSLQDQVPRLSWGFAGPFIIPAESSATSHPCS